MNASTSGTSTTAIRRPPELIVPISENAVAQKKLRRLRRLVRVMDQAVRIPGTRITVGLDGIAGLAPVVGDVATAAVSIYFIEQARRLGVRKPVVARMYANLAVDCLLGVFPVVGDLFDVAWKANVKNLRLLEDHFRE